MNPRTITGLMLAAALCIVIILDAMALHGDFGGPLAHGLRVFWGLKQ